MLAGNCHSSVANATSQLDRITKIAFVLLVQIHSAVLVQRTIKMAFSNLHPHRYRISWGEYRWNVAREEDRVGDGYDGEGTALS